MRRKTMAKFKVGDRVRKKNGTKLGPTGIYEDIITSVNYYSVTLKDSFWQAFREIELVVPPVLEPKFKVGDTVRCVNSDGEEFAIAQGANYLILNERDGDVELVGLNTFWFSSNRFELVTPKPKPEPTPSTYTVTWVAPRKNGYTSLIDGELSFGTEWEAYGFAGLFRSDVRTTVTKD
jgi:hypothetical protein